MKAPHVYNIWSSERRRGIVPLILGSLIFVASYICVFHAEEWVEVDMIPTNQHSDTAQHLKSLSEAAKHDRIDALPGIPHGFLQHQFSGYIKYNSHMITSCG